MGLTMKNFNIFGVHCKISFLGGVHEKPMQRGDCLNINDWEKDYSNLCWAGSFIQFILKEEHVHTNIFIKEAQTDTTWLYCTSIVEAHTGITVFTEVT